MMLKYFSVIIFMISCFCLMAQNSVSKLSLEKGKKLYEQYCLSCHQQDGEGVPNLNPPLIKTSYVIGDKKKLITWVLKGSLDKKVPIDGKFYSNSMPPQNFLKDDELANLLTYIRNSFGNKASAVTPAQVKSGRAQLK